MLSEDTRRDCNTEGNTVGTTEGPGEDLESFPPLGQWGWTTYPVPVLASAPGSEQRCF